MNNPAILQVFTSVVNRNHTFGPPKVCKNSWAAPVLDDFVVKRHKARRTQAFLLLTLAEGKAFRQAPR